MSTTTPRTEFTATGEVSSTPSVTTRWTSGVIVEMSCRTKCQRQDFGLQHASPTDFVESLMCGPSLLYVVYRFVMAAYFSTMTIYSFLTFNSYSKWFIYMTHWSYSVITLNTVLQAVCVTRHYINYKREGFDKECQKMRLTFKVIWVLQNITCTSAPLVSVMYWSLFYHGKGLDLANTNTHIANSVYVLIDILITAIPVRLAHFIYVQIFAMVYVSFTVIYWALGGKGIHGEQYIYSMLHHGHKPVSAVVWFIGLTLVSMVIHCCVFAVYLLRVIACGQCRRQDRVGCCDEGDAEAADGQVRAGRG
ncbi:hypothetical protein LSAT2_022204 [Lamellibrachia satsuma]|nr:hypothetical protein LSAT2_022204 [Lamellibrachia satsuma]